jgi:aminoglycoside phosphotransferase (APT) family kinase protein
MAALGAPEVDLAWMLYMHEFFRGLGEAAGSKPHPGLPPPRARDETYEELSGRRVRHLDYYEMFAGAALCDRLAPHTGRGIALGQMAPPENFEDRLMIRGHLELMLSGEYWRRTGRTSATRGSD